MAFNVAGLTDYVKENMDELIARSYFDSKTYDFLTSKGANTQSGIKTSERITLIAQDVIFQNDTACSFDASGATTFTNRTITVAPIKVNMLFCPKDLRAKYTQTLLKKGSMSETDIDSSWAKAVTDNLMEGISESMEKAWWQGDTTSSDVNLNKFDGLIKQTVSGTTAANTTALMGTQATSFTTSNIIAAVNSVWRALPEKVKGKSDVVIALGTDLYDLYTAAQVALNQYHYDAGTNTDYSFKIPGTGYTITGLPGLTGSNKIIGLRASNIYFGVDLEHEEEQFDMWYSKDDDNVKLKAAWKAGVQIAYPSEVVRFDLV